MKSICNLLNGTTFNDLEWPLTCISRSRHFLKWNIIKRLHKRKLYSISWACCCIWYSIKLSLLMVTGWRDNNITQSFSLLMFAKYQVVWQCFLCCVFMTYRKCSFWQVLVQSRVLIQVTLNIIRKKLKINPYLRCKLIQWMMTHWSILKRFIIEIIYYITYICNHVLHLCKLLI